ncbi:hypothetical protein ColTof4_06169 [Colletotrichum tofieldiae]|nr:hypothetical protein ColTof3_01352 [Colletotrichum tofieldiae]GKT73746.1 hypothetical protein ColTof4_06169 [Colletotrichum tofieldiae]GKT95705.1 hypothetical protein Ct61P_13555 [Colletotrichum tofieldiae]
MADDARTGTTEQQERHRRGLLPPGLVDLMGPPLKVGALTGTIGMFSGIAVGIVRDSTPALFALASGIQWFALGSSYWRKPLQDLILQDALLTLSVSLKNSGDERVGW